ncbi:MAG: hypothetical protein IT457_09340 [Planctomycetes bacterium]|nr:hypothetical protein [Planctomycetota bacterium]
MNSRTGCLVGVVSIAALGAAACAGPPPPRAAAEPLADALFHQDSRWRGGDGAYSIELGAGTGVPRSLWLFGDSFVERPGVGLGRSGCAMPRNTVALMTGDDPRTARLDFAWRGTREEPSAYFADEGELWHWPLHGLRVDDAVIVFCSTLKRDGEGIFGFAQVGWTAYRLTGIDGPLETWEQQQLATPSTPFPVAVGTAVVADGESVYAYALREPGDHALFLLRWPRVAFARGELLTPDWYDAGQWRPHADLRAAPAPILAEAAPEFSVHREAGADGEPARFVMVQILGFPAGSLAWREAPRPEGPWSGARVLFVPPEAARERVFTYSGKAHPQLRGPGLWLSYASNHAEFGTVVADLSLYWPRLVRVTGEGGRGR